MSEDERLDLTALDPLRDPERWRGVVEGTLARVDAVLRHHAPRADLWVLIAAWSRPVLAAAGICALLMLAAILSLQQKRPASVAAEPARRLAALTEGWAAGGPPPSGRELLGAADAGGR